MEFIVENWYIIIALIATGAAIGVSVYRFANKPTSEQITNVMEWLLGAVTEAEKELGGGTGQLKLRKVYDLFVERFSWLAIVIPFEVFSNMVDDALIEMRHLLQTNEAVETYVKSE